MVRVPYALIKKGLEISLPILEGGGTKVIMDGVEDRRKGIYQKNYETSQRGHRHAGR